MIRVEVDRISKTERRRVHVAYLDDPALALGRLTEAQRAWVDELLAKAVAAGVADTGLHPDDVAAELLSLAVERQADVDAYQREAARRGVLAL